MKYVVLIIVLAGFTQCSSVRFENKYPFTIKEASYYTWNGGQPGVSGIKLTVPVVNAEKIDFKKLYFNNKSVTVEIQKEGAAMSVVGFFNTSNNPQDNLVMDSNTTKELNNKVPNLKEFPFKLAENEAVVSYLQNGKTRYIKIENLVKKESPKYK